MGAEWEYVTDGRFTDLEHTVATEVADKAVAMHAAEANQVYGREDGSPVLILSVVTLDAIQIAHVFRFNDENESDTAIATRPAPAVPVAPPEGTDAARLNTGEPT